MIGFFSHKQKKIIKLVWLIYMNIFEWQFLTWLSWNVFPHNKAFLLSFVITSLHIMSCFKSWNVTQSSSSPQNQLLTKIFCVYTKLLPYHLHDFNAKRFSSRSLHPLLTVAPPLTNSPTRAWHLSRKKEHRRQRVSWIPPVCMLFFRVAKIFPSFEFRFSHFPPSWLEK